MEEEKYITIKDASERLKVTRPSLHHYIKVLGIEKHKFTLDKNAYLKVSDFERIRAVRQGIAKRTEQSEEVA